MSKGKKGWIMKKYELTNESILCGGQVLRRIKALTSFNDVSAGDLGGFVGKEENLSHNGESWVYDNGKVFGNAMVYDNAVIAGNAEIRDNAQVYGTAFVCDEAIVRNNARIYESAYVCDNASVSGMSRVYGDADIRNDASINDNACVYDEAVVFDWATISDDAVICGDAKIFGGAKVYDNAKVSSSKHIVWFSNVGSEDGILTAYLTNKNKIGVNRGCFGGSLKEFELAVKKHHGDNSFGKQYMALIQYIKLRFADVIKKTNPKGDD